MTLNSLNISIYKKEKAPDYVIGGCKIKLDDVKDYVNKDGYLILDLLKSSQTYENTSGYYLKINDFYYKKKNEEVEDIKF